MSTQKPLRIFVASPRDLKPQRDLIKSTIDRYNSGRRLPNEREYEVVGWEDRRGTVRRPQDEINELIASCEFMLVLFKKLWGSAPGGPDGFTSGTEEELFEGLLQLGDSERPMEDVWLGFMRAQSPARQVTALRTQLNETHALYYEDLADDLELDRKLSDRLAGWQKTAGIKTARHVELLPASGRQILASAKLRHDGEALIRLGDSVRGMDKL